MRKCIPKTVESTEIDWWKCCADLNRHYPNAFRATFLFTPLSSLRYTFYVWSCIRKWLTHTARLTIVEPFERLSSHVCSIVSFAERIMWCLPILASRLEDWNDLRSQIPNGIAQIFDNSVYFFWESLLYILWAKMHYPVQSHTWNSCQQFPRSYKNAISSKSVRKVTI